MKNLRTLTAAVVLTFLLTIPALAGEMECPIAPPPPPATPTTAVGGDIGNGVTGQFGSSEATTDSTLTEIALNLLANVLTMF